MFIFRIQIDTFNKCTGPNAKADRTQQGHENWPVCIDIIVAGQGTQIMLMRVDTAQANGSPRLDSSPGQQRGSILQRY